MSSTNTGLVAFNGIESGSQHVFHHQRLPGRRRGTAEPLASPADRPTTTRSPLTRPSSNSSRRCRAAAEAASSPSAFAGAVSATSSNSSGGVGHHRGRGDHRFDDLLGAINWPRPTRWCRRGRSSATTDVVASGDVLLGAGTSGLGDLVGRRIGTQHAGPTRSR